MVLIGCVDEEMFAIGLHISPKKFDVSPGQNYSPSPYKRTTPLRPLFGGGAVKCISKS